MNPNITKAHGAHPFGLSWIARRDKFPANGQLHELSVLRESRGAFDGPDNGFLFFIHSHALDVLTRVEG